MANVNQMILDKSYNYTMNAWDAFINDFQGNLIARADALSESAVNLTTEMVDKKGGSSNLILFSIPSSKELAATLTNLDFAEERLALQTGEKFNLGKFVVQGRSASCEVTTNANKREIELPEIPCGKNIYIENGQGNIPVAIPDPATKTIDITHAVSEGNKCVNVIYTAEVDSMQLDIGGDTPPAVINLILKKKVWNGGSGLHVKTITIDIPQFQLDGNLSFAGTLGDSDTMGLNGKAKASKSKTCGSTKQSLGSINIENVDGASVYEASQISATPSIEVSVGEADNITVMGMKGSDVVYTPFDITDKCTYTSADETKVTVDNTGKVTGVATTVGTPVKITIAFDGLTVDTEVTVVAAP